MQLFISWSGEKSKDIAEFLENWLKKVIQVLEPWISSDINKGLRWSPEISTKLENSKFGIICLTADNLDSKWILFEAGALSKTKDAHVCTLLIDLKSSDIEYPLAQFQHTSTNKEDFKKLIITINEKVQKIGEKSLSSETLDDVFETYWPHLEKKFSDITSFINKDYKPIRTEMELLIEILENVRNQGSKINQMECKISESMANDFWDRLNNPGKFIYSHLNPEGSLYKLIKQESGIQETVPFPEIGVKIVSNENQDNSEK